jgi:hypothetical protein
MGCPDAAFDMTCYDDVPFECAYWISRADHLGYPKAEISSKRVWFNKKYGRDAAIPYGRWIPDLHIHRMVPADIHWYVFRWLLIAKRARIPRYVAYIVVAYIVTK